MLFLNQYLQYCADVDNKRMSAWQNCTSKSLGLQCPIFTPRLLSTLHSLNNIKIILEVKEGKATLILHRHIHQRTTTTKTQVRRQGLPHCHRFFGCPSLTTTFAFPSKFLRFFVTVPDRRCWILRVVLVRRWAT